MFKPGDLALVVMVTGGRITTVKAMLRKGQQVETANGIYDEADLRQAEANVLASARGEDVTRRRLKEIQEERDVAAPKIDYALRHLVSEALKEAKLPFDLRGHWKGGQALHVESFKERVELGLRLLGREVPDADLRLLKKALAKGKQLDRWIDLGMCLATSTAECSYCGADRFHLETDGTWLRLSGDPCPHPNGLPPNSWELNVPSGKLVVANDLRQWFPLAEGEDGDANTTLGTRKITEAYAEAGMAHAFVGNTCPGVFKMGEGQFKIANPPPDEYFDGKAYVTNDTKPAFDGKRVASICTDLWWYSLCDADELKRRTKKFGAQERAITTISVKPGVYRFHHYDDAPNDDERRKGQETLFATFEWVRKPDPVKNYLKDWEEIEVNAHAYVQAQMKRWPGLYGIRRGSDRNNIVPWEELTEEQRGHVWEAVANQALCTIGSGTEWHEKGFPQAKVDRTIPDVEPPSFRRQTSWYPFSAPYGGLFEPKVLAPSFAKLAFRVLESVISFGTVVRDGERSRDVPDVRARMLVAVKRYRALAKQYPDLADPEYVWWLGQKGRAEAWVERFDLGPTFTKKHHDHASAQRWVPEKAYAIEFDAKKLKEGYFAWAKGCWARKEDAERYAIEEWNANGDPENSCFWACNASTTAIPLYSVARVVKVGDVSHMGDALVEIAFDYGTPWMKDASKRKAVREHKEKDAIRVLTKKEYEALLRKVTAS